MSGLLTLALMALTAGTTSAAQCSYTTSQSCGYFRWSTCPVTRYRYCEHGGWSSWNETSRSACSQSCGTGSLTISKARTCTNPSPSGGGNPCSGPSTTTDSIACNTQLCPIDGGWSNWTDWTKISKCTVLCGGGEKTQSRGRTCTNPVPRFGGRTCVGASLENRTISCSKKDCGDLCPRGQNTYIAASDQRYYYHCQEGQNNSVNTKAILMRCPKKTVWRQDTMSCVHEPEPDIAFLPTTAAGSCTEGATRADPNDCRFYLQCVSGSETQRQCPAGTKFDNSLGICNTAFLVDC